MLVLSRKIGQQILIGDGLVQIKVLKVKGDNISIGFTAPSHIDINREEIYIQKRAQRVSSLQTFK